MLNAYNIIFKVIYRNGLSFMVIICDCEYQITFKILHYIRCNVKFGILIWQLHKNALYNSFFFIRSITWNLIFNNYYLWVLHLAS